MAQVLQFGQNQDPSQQQNLGSSAAAPTIQAPIVPQGSTPAASNAANPTGTSSGRFTNLNQYLQANKGTNMGGQIVNNLSSQANNLSGQFDNAENASKQQAQQGAAPSYNSGFVSNFLANPSQSSQDPNNAALFNQYRDASYTGPTSIQGINNIVAQGNNLATETNQGTTEAGRQTLLQNLFGQNGGYTQGQQTLDNLLINSDPNQVSQLQNLGSVGQGLTNKFANEQTNFGNLVNQYTGQAADTQAQTRQALQNTIQGIGTQAQQTLDTTNTARQNQFNDIKSSLNSGTPNDATMQSLGLTPNMNTYGVNDFTKYLTSGNPLNINQALTPDQYSQLQALSNISGNALSGTAAATTLQNLAGSPFQGGAQAPAYTFNNAQLNGDIASNKAAWTQGFQGASNAQQSDISTIGNMIQQANKTAMPVNQVFSNWLNQYKADPKSFAESVIGDQQGYSGPQRDAIIKSMQDYTAQQGALNNLTSTYNPASSLGSQQVIAPSYNPAAPRKVVGSA